ncbi:hypothetical protein XAP412_1140005 [Xanthomonas phaseoli pv. phaseoli]|uniref:Uncharacterized protein n=1 Tax=Xanthomonas campestris pv. phaseoli TaxID=317013 RepID=A0AB38DWU0_XANCH|nr:hypothetical protein XAP6984_1190005 [Xanthomonas phaseoli pv. phaseoli]SON76516.1 hypothetical protein XAP412_1140005 [Xanthomonas phaseoli pv. phaseoli]SON81043.1 hypothetical protein XAP7430_1160005 [Xanthomonas phaseoli pv. phaseoli]SOO30918.1 hypothetical protein XAP6164_4910007 [Xanthomonas phaseoli pv. phaseoli]
MTDSPSSSQFQINTKTSHFLYLYATFVTLSQPRAYIRHVYMIP